MYKELLHIHNLLRWLDLIALVLAVLFAFYGWLGKREWDKKDSLTGLFLIVLMNIQFLTGIILYAFLSPVTQHAFANFGAAMKNPELRFYAVEHISMMVIAIVLINAGWMASKKAKIPWKKHRAVIVFYVVALLLLILAIPWDKKLI